MSDERPSRGEGPARAGDRLMAALQGLLPHHILSRCAGALAGSRLAPVRAPMIGLFRRAYGVDLAEALEPDPGRYPSFNAFFTRALRPEVRPVTPEVGAVASPVDGAVSAAGTIAGDALLQAKGREYGLTELLGGSPERAVPFEGGSFVTLYLSPRDYHRVHMPLAGRLTETVHVPGRLFAVNPPAVRAVPRLFARNERVAALFDTEAGPMAVVLVGALLVGSIETVWAGRVTPPRGREIRSWVPEAEVRLTRGAELGRFAMGSSVIVVFPPGRVRWDDALAPGAELRMGRRIGAVEEPGPAGGGAG
jgi:phosphatidylserine decarboxylase